jgi:hypothetical protein
MVEIAFGFYSLNVPHHLKAWSQRRDWATQTFSLSKAIAYVSK